VFPEGSAFLLPRDKDGRPVALVRADKRAPGIITSEPYYSSSTTLTRMVYYDPARTEPTFTDKRIPQPLGEYMTASAYAIGVLLGAREAMDTIASKRNVHAGEKPVPQLVNGIRVGALFCNEVFSPARYNTLARDGAEVFINASSQDWFHESRLLHMQNIRAARIHAAANHRPYVQSSNTSPSFALDAYGRTLAETAWGESSVLIVDVPISHTRTPYAFYGAWVLILPALVVLVFLVPPGFLRQCVSAVRAHISARAHNIHPLLPSKKRSATTEADEL
jgi:apolipoprotein N-acyltransferase